MGRQQGHLIHICTNKVKYDFVKIIIIIIFFNHSVHSCFNMYTMVIKGIYNNVPYNRKSVNVLFKNRCKVFYVNHSKPKISCTRTASALKSSNLYSFLIVV